MQLTSKHTLMIKTAIMDHEFVDGVIDFPMLDEGEREDIYVYYNKLIKDKYKIKEKDEKKALAKIIKYISTKNKSKELQSIMPTEAIDDASIIPEFRWDRRAITNATKHLNEPYTAKDYLKLGGGALGGALIGGGSLAAIGNHLDSDLALPGAILGGSAGALFGILAGAMSNSSERKKKALFTYLKDNTKYKEEAEKELGMPLLDTYAYDVESPAMHIPDGNGGNWKNKSYKVNGRSYPLMTNFDEHASSVGQEYPSEEHWRSYNELVNL